MSGRIITVNFRGDDLYGFERDDGSFLALRPMVEAMGLDWSAQLKRVKRDPILSEGMAMMATPSARGGDQEAVCLRLDLVNGWLFTIDAGRIKDEAVRAKVLVYQRECYAVLARHFARGEAPAAAPILPGEETTEAESGRLRLVTEARHVFGARAAGQLWFRLGLPIVPAMAEQRRQLDLLDYERIRAAGDEPGTSGEGRAA